MDKRTINTMLLMCLAFALFMYLTPRKEVESTAEEPDVTTESPVNIGIDSLMPTEREWLVKNLLTHGDVSRAADGSPIYTLNQEGMNLSLRGDSITGTVTVSGRDLIWADVAAGNTQKMTVAEQREAIRRVREASVAFGKYGSFARFLAGTPKEVSLENDVLSLTLNTKSGSVTRAELKDYDTEYSSDETKKEKRKVVLFEGDSNTFNFQIPLPQPVETAELYFTLRQVNDCTVLMALEFAPDSYWGIEYTLPRGDSYVVRVNVVQKNVAAVAQSNNRNLGFSWTQNIHRQEQGRMFEERYSGLYYKFAGGSVENLSESKNDSEERKSKIRWIGFKNQFFSCVMIADRAFNNATMNSTVLKGSDYLKTLQADAQVSDYDWNSPSPASFSLYMGPNLYPLLDKLSDRIVPDEDLKLTKLIPLGWSIFRWINTLVVIPVFSFLGKFISNYGIIILLLTIFIKLILFPLTYKSYKSQAVMRVLAPEVKAINDKYPGQDNAMIRQQKTMALYSKAGANPMSGCLPLLLQMPILFAMFAFFPNAIELRGQSFLWAHDLSAPDAIISWSGNIPLVTKYFGNHISLFCLLMTATNILYTYLNSQNQQNSMPGMKWMMYLMPVFFMVFFNNYASGLSYYYFVSLLITIIQTYAFRFIIKEETVRKQMAEAAKKPKKKSKFMQRLEEMQKQQQAMMREQQRQQGKGRR